MTRVKRSIIAAALVMLVAGLLASPLAAAVYHGNQESKIFHSPDCRHYSCKACTVKLSSRDEALNRGFRPCKVCKP